MSVMQYDKTVRVLSSTPDGAISHLDAATMEMMVAECRTGIKRAGTIAGRVKMLLTVADTCRINGYSATALGLYREVFRLIIPDAVHNYSMRHRDLMLAAARGIDDIWSRKATGAHRVSECFKVRMFYLCILDTYLYYVRNIKNPHVADGVDFELVEEYYKMADL